MSDSKSSASYWTPTIGLVGGWLLAGFWPGAILGGAVGWGVGKVIDAVRSPSAPGSGAPATAKGAASAAAAGTPAQKWSTGGVANSNGMTWNDPLLPGTGSSSGVQVGDPYNVIAPDGLKITALTVDNPKVFRVVGSRAPTLPATSVSLTPVMKGTVTFSAKLSNGGSSKLTTTVG